MNQLVFKRDNQNQLTIPSSLRIVWILSLLALMITIPNDLEAQAIWKALDASELKKASQADQRKPDLPPLSQAKVYNLNVEQ